MNEKPAFSPLTYLITNGDALPSNFSVKREEILVMLELAVKSGITMIQIREKSLPARSLLELAQDAATITRSSGTRLLINGRADIALAAGADGVHLPADGLSAAVVRKSFPAGLLIGVSTHSVDEAMVARADGADFVTFGPVFGSPGKGEGQGLESLASVAEAMQAFPVVALGGVDETNLEDVLNAGAAGFAAIRFLNNPANLSTLAEMLAKL